jgi:site-specific DNA-cytosine methylase
MRIDQYLCSTLTKFGISPRIFTKIPNMKFHVNPSSRNRADASGQTDELRPDTISVKDIAFLEIYCLRQNKT